MSNAKTQVEKATLALQKAVTRMSDVSGNVIHEGTKIVVPEQMDYASAGTYLLQLSKQLEEEVKTTTQFTGEVGDILYNFRKAMIETFGALMESSEMVETFFGSMLVPARNWTVYTDFGVTEQVPYGNMRVPGLPIKINVEIGGDEVEPWNGQVVVNFTYQRKYQTLIEMMIGKATKYLESNSIYRGKAIDSHFTYLDLRVDTSKIVYSEQEARELDANIFSLIRNANEVAASGVPLKRTVLMYGPFGTGKTFTALRAAQLAVKHGHTFIMVRPGDDVVKVLTVARKYQPVVIFFEDVDIITSGERSDYLNQVLNTVDGLLGKGDQVLTILTTNRMGHINRAMLRKGRVDATLRMGMLDQSAVVRMVRAYGGDNLESELDEDAIWQAAKDFPPAFIAGAVNQANLYRISRNAKDGTSQPKMSSGDVVSALIEAQAQYKLMLEDQTVDTPTLNKAFQDAIRSQVDEALHPIYNYMGINR